MTLLLLRLHNNFVYPHFPVRTLFNTIYQGEALMIRKVIFSLAAVTVLFSSSFCMSRDPGDYNYWGHGFGMGYGMGCFDNQSIMMNALGINREQADKIADIDVKYRRLYYENSRDFDKIESLRKEHRKEIEAVLDDSQKSKFNSAYNNRWNGWGRKWGRRHMGDFYGQGYGMGYGCGLYSSADYMKRDLDLTSDQIRKISDIDVKYRDMYNNSRGDYRKIEDLRRKHRGEIEKVLTPEQKKKYDEAYDYRWRGRGRGRGMMGPGMMGF